MNNGNYPLLTQSEYNNAPFNEQDPPLKEVDVCCSQSLSRDVNILAEYDDFNEEFICLANDYFLKHETPLSLIEEFYRCLKKGDLPSNTKYWMKECKGWIEDEMDVVEN
nr:MAG TPA: hypothetical protein [Caudoviricetes sp.]